MPAQRYQHYCNGPYALVDSYYNGIWMTIQNESLAHNMRKIFVSKIPFLVFDLRSFDNFDADQNTVDSSVCFAWQVPKTHNEHMVSPNLYDPVFEKTLVRSDYTDQTSLINQPDSSPLGETSRWDLQDQLFLYKNLWQLFHAEHIVGWFESNKHQKDQKDFFELVQEHFKIELTTENIEKKLHALAFSSLDTHFFSASLLLKFLGANLYG